MKCNIEYTGKLRIGRPQYFCTTHKHLAVDKSGNKLPECLCTYKELFANRLDLKTNKITSIKIIYDDIFISKIPSVYVNENLFNGVLVYDDSVLTYKDLGGIMLAKLNNVKLENVACHHCGKMHSDNGQFAYKPHRTHFCNYCGHLFRVQDANISQELETIYDIPMLKLANREITIGNKCQIEYDLFTGTILINKEVGNKVIINNKKIDLQEFLNDALKNEY